MKGYRIGEIEVPTDYFKLSKDEKDQLCNDIMDVMIEIIDRNIRKDLNRLEVLDKMLESSIITNIDDEQYEVCAVLQDIRNLLNHIDE